MNTQIQKENLAELPEGFTVRGATTDDLELAMMLFNRWSRSVIGRDELIDLDAFHDAVSYTHLTLPTIYSV